jgi:cell division protein FtsI/penicillin-binding protein 2
MMPESEETGPASRRRLVILWMGIIVGVLVLVGRLFYWQVVRRDDLQKVGEQWQLLDRPIPALRGTIVDRNGFILAMDDYEFEIFATPKDIDDRGRLAAELAPILGVDQGQLAELLSRENEPYVRLVWRAPVQAVRAVEQVKERWVAEDLLIRGLAMSPNRHRVYPESEMACHLLGLVTHDHEAEYEVYYGVEEFYDEKLRGVVGSWGGTGDVLGLHIAIAPGTLALPQDGLDVVLTVDRSIQQIVEAELRSAIGGYRAEKGTIIVMEPRTGAILAMASYPGYDPDRYSEEPIREELFTNPAVSEAYEPGSVFKVITMAAAMDAGIVSRDSVYNDTGQILVGGRLIQNWDRRAYGTTTMTGLLGHSLNVGAATLSTNLGSERFYDYLQRFGCGEATGIDLPHEAPGIMRVPGDSDWREADLGTNSFGQGIALTPIQIVTAIAAVANDGALPKPHVLQRIEQEGRIIEDSHPQAGRQVISASVAQQLTEMLVESVAEKENIAVPGYAIAGKTGTAQIPIAGGYHPDDTVASFVGYAPAYDPQFIILVKLHRPQESPWGSQVAAPVFRRIAERLFVYLDIPPDTVRLASR